jgi:hypothetical protein
MLALASFLFSTSGGAQIHDSARIQGIIGVAAPLSPPLAPNHDFTFRATVLYSLGSLDEAVVNVDAEEYQGPATGPNGCRGLVHATNGGNSAPIRRGSGNVKVDVTWKGSHPLYGNKSQFVGLFVTISDPKANKVIFSSFPPLPKQCFISAFTM